MNHKNLQDTITYINPQTQKTKMVELSTQIVIIGIGVVLVAVGVIWSILTYNHLVFLRNNNRKAWSNVDVLLKQRQDELLNLISTVKGYKNYEEKTLLALVAARTAFMSAKTVSQKSEASNQISGAVKSLFAVSENYPQLAASQNFLKLQSRITELENQLADRREFYNNSVTIYNTSTQTFPSMVIANGFTFTKEDLFVVEASAAAPVVVSFDESSSPKQ